MRIRFLLFVCLLFSWHSFAETPLFDWSSAIELYPGILHAQLALQEPRLLKINAVRIDLVRPEIQFPLRRADVIKYDAGQPEHVIRTKRQRTCDYISQARLPKEQAAMA